MRAQGASARVVAGPLVDPIRLLDDVGDIDPLSPVGRCDVLDRDGDRALGAAGAGHHGLRHCLGDRRLLRLAPAAVQLDDDVGHALLLTKQWFKHLPKIAIDRFSLAVFNQIQHKFNIFINDWKNKSTSITACILTSLYKFFFIIKSARY